MALEMLDWWEVASWAISEFQVSAGTASAVLLLRILWRRTQLKPIRLLPGVHSRSLLLGSQWASTVPFLVWALEANSLSQVVMATHASVNPNLLLASMQLFLGGIFLLALIFILDIFGRGLQSAKFPEPRTAEVPLVVVFAVGTVLTDWLLSQVAWWALIHRSSTLAAP